MDKAQVGSRADGSRADGSRGAEGLRLNEKIATALRILHQN